MKAFFVVSRFITEDVPVHEGLVDEMAVVVSEDADHDLGIGGDVAVERDMIF